MPFSYIIQSVISGLLLGGIYALLSIGFSLTWGTMQVLNISQAAFAVLGAYVAYWFFVLAGVLCIAIIIWAGISYATAGGDEEKVGKAKTRLIYGIIGVAVIIAAYAITQFIAEALNTGKIPEPAL